MKLVLLAALAAIPSLLFGGTDSPQLSELNINSRYTVESIDFAGQKLYRLSDNLVESMQRLVGQKLNVEALNRLARQMTDELRARAVRFSIQRGMEPAHVRVLFDVDKPDVGFDFAVAQFAYTSREGLTGAGQASALFGANTLSFTAITDGDDLVERYSGIRARYERRALGTDRVRVAFEFDAFKELYNGATQAMEQSLGPQMVSSLGAGTYRSRLNVEPSATFVLSKPLTLTVGMSFETLGQTATGVAGPALTQAANSLLSNVRLRRHWGEAGSVQQDLEAGYRLRAGLRSIGSDFAYSRHLVDARYRFRRQAQSVDVAVMAGVIYGQAPLFERFVLGTGTTLRGWDKYELDPLGGNRVAYASVTYGYHIMRVFYDTGSIWDSGRRHDEKHSVGVGVTTGLGLFGKDALLLAVACPIQQGRVVPVFIAGMNFGSRE